MTALLTTAIGSLTALIPNIFRDILAGKAKKAEQDYEIEKLKALAEVNANAEAAKANADSEARQAEANSRALEAQVKLSEINANRAAIKTGIKWIDAGDAVVRLAYGVISIIILTWASLQAYRLGVEIWKQAEIWDIICDIVRFFIGYGVMAYTCKKVYKDK